MKTSLFSKLTLMCVFAFGSIGLYAGESDYCHTPLTTGDGSATVYLTCQNLSGNLYQIKIEADVDMTGLGGSHCHINGTEVYQMNVEGRFVISDDKRTITLDITSTTPPSVYTPLFVMMPGEKVFTWPQNVDWSLCAAPPVTVVPAHGSIRGRSELYGEHNANAFDPSTVRKNGEDSVWMNFSVVTIGGKSWATTSLSALAVGNADWASQLRYWSATNAKTENNLLSRVGTTTTFGSTTKTIPNPLANISFFQAVEGTGGGYSETPFMVYDPVAKNSAVAGDTEAPVLTSGQVAISNITESGADLTFSGTDNSNNLFYYITYTVGTTDYAEVALLPTFTVTGLQELTTTDITITPVDYNGNEGESVVVPIATGGFVQITSGIAKDIKFVLLSSAGHLEYYYELTDPTKTFHDASIKITGPGLTGGDFKPAGIVIGRDNWVQGVINDGRLAADGIYDLNLCYFVYEPYVGEPNYGAWVTDNTKITEGDKAGLSIKHAIGQGINPADAETNIPTFTSVVLDDETTSSVDLTLTGSDDSGVVYYEITGAKSTTNAFKTGAYKLTNTDPGTVYNLSIVAKDLSGNTSAAQTLSVRSSNSFLWTNVENGQGCAYNTVAATTNPELVVQISEAEGALTLGCTTLSDKVGNQRVFYGPTVRINGVDYPLTLDGDNKTATATFTGTIGDIPVVAGTALKVRWSVYWNENLTGNFFTGTYDYIIGYPSLVEVEPPTVPVLTLVGSALSWNPCTDTLSGVKKYVVEEAGQPAVTIWNLDQASFSHTLVDADAITRVTVYDYADNTAYAEVNDETVGNTAGTQEEIKLYPNPAVDYVQFNQTLQQVTVYNMQGVVALVATEASGMDVSHLNGGLYVVKAIARDGSEKVLKLTVSK
jgi:hypothetical protein